MNDKDAYSLWPKTLQEYNAARFKLERRARQLADALINVWPAFNGRILPMEAFTRFYKVEIRGDSIEVWYSQPWSEGASDFIEFSARELDEPIELLHEQAYMRAWSSALGEDKRRTDAKLEREQRDRRIYEQLKAKFDPKRGP